MRNSQRVVLAVIGGIAVLIVVLGIWLRVAAPDMPELSGERATQTYDLAGFDGIDVSGQWLLTVERGDAWRVAVEAPVEVVENLDVAIDGDRLSLHYEGGWCAGCFRGDRALEATVTMPALESLDSSGTTNISFSGFEGSALSLDVSGAVQLRGSASRFDALTLDLSGAGEVDLSEVSTTNAEVDVSGAGNVKLLMAGGRLTGDMSGAANLEYSGPVSEESVERSGFVNVRRRN
jgi:hypothetical protein